jgi:membrane-associated protein
MAESFYKKYGAVALTAGLFLPIIRTFAPIVAGMINLSFRRFVIYTFAGSILWIVSMVSSGYLLGKIPFLKEYLNYIIIIIVIVVTVPIVIRIIKEFKKVRVNNEKKT